MKKVSKKLIFYIPSSRSESDIDIPSKTLLYDSNEYQLFYIQKKKHFTVAIYEPILHGLNRFPMKIHSPK